MKSVPFLPALLGFLLVIPFIYAALALAGLVTPPRTYWADPYAMLNAYGAIYLAMLGGVYWGFAAKRPNILDVLIAIVPPFAALGGSFYQLPVLPFAIGIAAMLVFDILYIARGMAPRWWLSLRIYTSIIAVGALVYAYYA
jgi:hypothetical protein